MWRNEPLRDAVEVDGRGDLAYVRGRYSMVMALPSQPELSESGKYIEIWRKQPDGSWKLFRDIFNADAPPAPAAAPPATK